MMDKDKIKEVGEYFTGEIERLDIQMLESEELYQLIHGEVKGLLDNQYAARGNSKYKADMVQNLVSMSAQRKAIWKEQVNMTKLIIDLSMKDKTKESEEAGFKEILLQLMAENRKKKPATKKAPVKKEVIVDAVKEAIKEIEEG